MCLLALCLCKYPSAKLSVTSLPQQMFYDSKVCKCSAVLLFCMCCRLDQYIIIIIIIIHPCYHFYAGYLQLFTCSKPHFYVAAVLYLHSVLHVMLYFVREIWFLWNMICTFTLAFPIACVDAQYGCPPPPSLSFWICALLVCCLGIVWVILKLFHLLLLLLVSLLLLLPTCAKFLLSGLLF